MPNGEGCQQWGDGHEQLPKTARFWTGSGDNLVRLSLREGQTLSWSKHWQTDEGWVRVSCVWEYEDGVVRYIERQDGADCDGRYSSEIEGRCSWHSLAAHEADNGLMLPKWTWGNTRQRDFTAEAAGY